MPRVAPITGKSDVPAERSEPTVLLGPGSMSPYRR